MLGFRCANPAIIRDVEPGPREAKRFIHAVRPVDEIDLVLLRGFHHVLAVLVQTYTEVGIVSLQTMIASNDVRRHFFEGMPDMRGRVRVIDSCCNVIAFICRFIFANAIHLSPLFVF